MLTVRDIMNPKVVTIPPEATVRELTRVLVDAGITGAPVVDRNGALVGVVSSTDVVRLSANNAAAMAPDRDAPTLADLEGDDEEEEDELYDFFLPEDFPFAQEDLLQLLPDGEMDRVTVADIMTGVSYSVSPETSIPELAAFLVRGRIHRAVVVEREKLVGIVSAMDVLRVVAEGRET